MYVHNVHSRDLAGSAAQVGALLDSLSSPDDRLWPNESWPRMRFDRPLGVGAVGGHGPIRYVVESYEPGLQVRFRFTGPRGFVGTHGLDVEAMHPGRTTLVHSLEMEARGAARIGWPLLFRPLHDALVEDALDQAERSLGLSPHGAVWSRRVRALRLLMRTAGRARPKR